MEFMIINQKELSVLRGLPWLQQLTYLQGIKPFVDYKTGIVGIRRGISYQSLSEALYIEPHSGIQSGSPSKDQLRRALKGLEKAGVIVIQSLERKLILRCLFLDLHDFVRNKPTIKPQDDSAINASQINIEKSINYGNEALKHNTSQPPQLATPQNNNNYFFIFLLKNFDAFWDLYPQKKEKENAFEVFKKLNPSQTLVHRIMAGLAAQIKFYHQQLQDGIWVPAWKYPANWLTQRCWETTIVRETKEYEHAIDETNPAKPCEARNFSDSEFQKLWKPH
ncbi:MAG: Vir protein [Tatlockia sp.]|nr:Vir protein [Tatlockia sp.]